MKNDKFTLLHLMCRREGKTCKNSIIRNKLQILILVYITYIRVQLYCVAYTHWLANSKNLKKDLSLRFGSLRTYFESQPLKTDLSNNIMAFECLGWNAI